MNLKRMGILAVVAAVLFGTATSTMANAASNRRVVAADSPYRNMVVAKKSVATNAKSVQPKSTVKVASHLSQSVRR